MQQLGPEVLGSRGVSRIEQKLWHILGRTGYGALPVTRVAVDVGSGKVSPSVEQQQLS
jgi:hypothetical protein